MTGHGKFISCNYVQIKIDLPIWFKWSLDSLYQSKLIKNACDLLGGGLSAYDNHWQFQVENVITTLPFVCWFKEI